jgi:hypothetical protein
LLHDREGEFEVSHGERALVEGQPDSRVSGQILIVGTSEHGEEEVGKPGAEEP